MSELFQDTTFWVLISFVIFAGIVWHFGRASLVGILDRRIETIRKEIQTAESLRVEAQELLAQYQRRQRDAAREAETIIEAARKNADAIRRQAEDDIEETITRKEAQLADRLRRMEETTVQEIRAHAAELAVRATAEIIAKQMDDKTNARLVDDSIKALAGRLN